MSGTAATNDGVWAATPTGMMGTLQFFRASDLATTATYPEAMINSVVGSIASGVLWVNAQGAVVCADPATGVVRDTIRVGDPESFTRNVAETSSGLYTVNDDGVFMLDAPPGCEAEG